MESNDEDTRECWVNYTGVVCPDYPKCNGYCHGNKFYHGIKCSKCNKYWIDRVEWFEVKDFKHLEEETK